MAVNVSGIPESVDRPVPVYGELEINTGQYSCEWGVDTNVTEFRTDLGTGVEVMKPGERPTLEKNWFPDDAKAYPSALTDPDGVAGEDLGDLYDNWVGSNSLTREELSAGEVPSKLKG